MAIIELSRQRRLFGFPLPHATASVSCRSEPAPVATPLPADGPADAAPAMRAIADRLEQRVAADFALFGNPFVAARRRRGDRAMRRLAAHLAAEARPLHALGRFTLCLELSPDSANALALPEDLDPATLPEGWADAVYSNRLASHGDLAGMRQLLRPGGVLVADLPAGGPIAVIGRIVGLELAEFRDPGPLQGRAWQRAILVRPTGD